MLAFYKNLLRKNIKAGKRVTMLRPSSDLSVIFLKVLYLILFLKHFGSSSFTINKSYLANADTMLRS